MKNSLIFLFTAIMCFCNCIHGMNNKMTEERDATFETTDIQSDTVVIRKLIQQAIDWSESAEAIDVYPVEEKGNIYSFDKRMLEENLVKLIRTGFFSSEFIENYNQIILTLDRKLKNKELDEWVVGDLPPFKFANDISAWCMCQGYSSDQLGNVKVIKMDSKSGELIWKWKKGSSWIDFKIRIKKENSKWKITYLQGFDYKEGIKRTGEI